MSRHSKTARASIGGFVTQWDYSVQVCSFTFNFSSLEEIQRYLDYFGRKTHPSGRVYNVGKGYEDHYDCQTEFQKLPLYLSEEPKRQKVIKALQKALAEFSQ